MFLRRTRTDNPERGSTLVFVAVSMVVLIAMAGLAIDLVYLYVGRSEAQRAADAAALAGASAFNGPQGCTSVSGGCVAGGSHETVATQQAIAAGTQNQIAGTAPTVLAGDVSFSYPTPQNPTITVQVARDATHGGPLPTFFMRIFGVATKDVSATATAEAFNASGSGIPVGTKCLKPWLMPNCNYNNLVSATSPLANLNCPGETAGTYASKFIDNGSIIEGSVGQLVTVKPGDPSEAAAPSKFYPVYLPPGDIPAICPACAGGGGGGGASSGSLYRQNIECCNTSTIACGQQTIQPITGNMVGPTQLGVRCLIHQEANGSGQDLLQEAFSSTTFTITAGSNNPYYPAGATPIATSDSVVTVPLYNGTTLCPGNSCPSTTTVDVVGFMQVFVQDVDNSAQGTVHVKVMNIVACDTSGGGGSGGSGGGSGGSGTISGGGASPIPVRLIRQ